MALFVNKMKEKFLMQVMYLKYFLIDLTITIIRKDILYWVKYLKRKSKEKEKKKQENLQSYFRFWSIVDVFVSILDKFCVDDVGIVTRFPDVIKPVIVIGFVFCWIINFILFLFRSVLPIVCVGCNCVGWFDDMTTTGCRDIIGCW